MHESRLAAGTIVAVNDDNLSPNYDFLLSIYTIIHGNGKDCLKTILCEFTIIWGVLPLQDMHVTVSITIRLYIAICIHWVTVKNSSFSTLNFDNFLAFWGLRSRSPIGALPLGSIGGPQTPMLPRSFSNSGYGPDLHVRLQPNAVHCGVQGLYRGLKVVPPCS